MVNTLNLNAETNANMIGDDSVATLGLLNTGGGMGLHVGGLACASTASIDVGNVASLTATSLTASTAAGNVTVAAFKITGSSIASGALFGLINDSAFVSTETIDVTVADQSSAVIKVVKPDGTFGWIPVYTDAQVTAAAI